MVLSSSLSPLFLSPVPSSVPQQSKSRGRASRKDQGNEQVLLSSSTSVAMSRTLTPCSLKEVEIETSIYFPTFASRRKLSPQRQDEGGEKRSPRDASNAQQDKSALGAALLPSYPDTFEEEDDEIFALEEYDDEEQEELMDEDDGGQHTADIPSLDLDRMTVSNATRRQSEQTASSISEQDLQMVWEEEDDEEDEETEEMSPVDDTTIIVRKSSTSSSAASRLLVRRESMVASRKSSIKPQILPSLTFARRIERPMETAISASSSNSTSSSSPTFSNHWQKPRRGSSTLHRPMMQKPLQRSSTVSVANPLGTNRTASLERYRAFPDIQINRLDASKSEIKNSFSIRSNTFPHLGESSVGVKSNTKPSSPSSILFGGRKRSATDPLAVHPPYQTK